MIAHPGRRHAVALSGLLAVCGCLSSITPGTITARVEWVGPKPPATPTLYAFARIEQRTPPFTAVGTVLQGVGPAAYPNDVGTLVFGPVLNNDNLVVVVELHQGSNARSAVLYDGVSAPFTMNPGVDQVVTVTLSAVPSAPDTEAAGLVTYQRAPWGSEASGGAPAFSVKGLAGAATPGTTVVVYDGANPLNASQLGSQGVDATGAFTVKLTPAVDRQTVFLAQLDSAGNPSVTASPVHEVAWTATFGGKTPGNTTANPNVLTTSSWFSTTRSRALWTGPLIPDPATAAEASSYSVLAAAGSGPGIVATTGTSLPWVQRATAGGPAATQAAMVFDAAAGVSLLFGGEIDVGGVLGALSGTWAWDGEHWTEVATAAMGPSPRAGHAMAYDSRRGVTIVFSGSPWAAVSEADTWEWDGIVWHQVVAEGPVPPARSGHVMAYDAARGVTVLFGGQNDSNQLFHDQWGWDGVHWTQMTPSTGLPPARTQGYMGYDAGRSRVLLIGGESASASLTDTWAWDGGTWTELTSTFPTGGTGSGGVAYDWRLDSMMLFDGANLWRWDDETWQTAPGAPVLAGLSHFRNG